ncbi:MAG: tyrosine--tRNA ligase, partial [Actinobacteria bacterium]|nr:tyrosine--tRNA ligase [Actinomycetota bacterium]
MATIDEQIKILTAGAQDVVRIEDLTKKLEANRPLRVKLGVDPTASDIHLGFAVVLSKLRQFQDLGHTAVLIIGDFTAMLGDPSGRSATRPQLEKEEVDAYAATYVEQAERILDPKRLEIRRNSEWLGKMGIDDILRLTARTTVAQMIERDDFSRRYQSGEPISLMEFLYPLLQGWDSVVVESDVELGGTDQLFNNLVGRTLQQQVGQSAQVVMTMPLLVGTDGEQKMSKSLGNFIGITEPPEVMFGKIMSIPDESMAQYFSLTTRWHPDQVAQVNADIVSGEMTPVAAKRLLARTVVDLYHGSGEAAEAEFDSVLKSHDQPADIPEHELDFSSARDQKLSLAEVLNQAGLAKSNREGRRLIEQGGVRWEGESVSEAEAAFSAAELDGTVLQVGRRRWVRLVSPD